MERIIIIHYEIWKKRPFVINCQHNQCNMIPKITLRPGSKVWLDWIYFLFLLILFDVRRKLMWHWIMNQKNLWGHVSLNQFFCKKFTDLQTIQLEIAVRGIQDCSEQRLVSVALRDAACPAVSSCHGYNLTPQLPDTTFCLVNSCY